MTLPPPATDFRAKRWIFRAQAILWGFLSLFGLALGPLFLMGLMKNEKGDQAEDAGLALTLIGLAFSPVFALAIFNLLATRRPVLRIRREGVEVRMIGESSLDRIPLVPGLVRVAWSILSGQSFRTRVVRIPWPSLQSAVVSGSPGLRALTLAWRPEPGRVETVALPDASFARPLDEIADAIRAYAEGRADASRLQRWNDPGLFLE